MVDSHLMLSAMKTSLERFAAQRSGKVGRDGHTIRNLSAPCGGCAKWRTACKGAQQKEQAMTTPKPRPSIVHGESHSYPVLPLRDIVVFPHMIVPLFVGREKSIRALEEVMKNDALIMLATQKNASDDDPSPDSIYETGTLASVLQLLKLPDGTVKVLVEGLER